MKVMPNKLPRVFFTPGFYLYLALLILLVPLRWLLAAAVSIAVHEICHIVAIRCFGIPIESIRIALDGARIQACPLTPGQELICALAGPVGGLCLLPLARWCPVTALCAAFHSLYNLLPVYPQDGGRVLRCGARLLLQEKWVNPVCGFIEYTCLILIGVLGLYGTFILKAGVVPAIFAIVFLRRSFGMKNSLQSS
jgi:Zn-dependent protease